MDRVTPSVINGGVCLRGDVNCDEDKTQVDESNGDESSRGSDDHQF